MLREKQEYNRILDLFRLLLMARVDDTLIPELLEIVGKDATLSLLDLLAGETIVLPEAGVLENDMTPFCPTNKLTTRIAPGINWSNHAPQT